MKQVKIQISGYVNVPDEATARQIEEAVKFNVGLSCFLPAENPIGDSLKWYAGWVDVM